MLDANAAEAAVDALRPMLTGDGADIEVTAIDAPAGTIDLNLVIGEEACLECVIEPQMLHEIIREHLHRNVPGFTWANINDPRVNTAL